MRTPQTSTDLIRTYLREIGRIPLLTHEQEVSYGRQVQQLQALYAVRTALTEQQEHPPTLTEWLTQIERSPLADGVDRPKTVEELQHIINAGETARRKMMEANLRLVVAVAKKYTQRNLELLDLIQEGSIGLQRAVEKFDPARGYRFSTYAYWWIRQSISRAIAEQGRAIRLPIHITEKLNKLKQAQRQLAQQLGRAATTQELAHHLGFTPQELREYLSWARHTTSLDARVNDDQESELKDLLEAPGIPPETAVERYLLQADLERLITRLPSQQQTVLTLRFGLETGQSLSLAEIGRKLHISRERVRQLEQAALRHLRQHQADIAGYLDRAIV